MRRRHFLALLAAMGLLPAAWGRASDTPPRLGPSASTIYGRAFTGATTPRLVAMARRNASETLPPGTRYEIRQAVSGGAVAWFAYPDWQGRAAWVHGRPGFDVVSGTFIHERGTT